MVLRKLTRPDSVFQNLLECAPDTDSMRMEDLRGGSAQYIFGSPPKQTLGPFVPIENPALHVLDEDGILRVVEQFRLFAKIGIGFFELLARVAGLDLK